MFICIVPLIAFADPYYVVNSNGDSGDANPGDMICSDSYGLCTLRAAVDEINASGYANAIIISDLSVDTIPINASLQINRAMTITGAGKDITKIQYNGVNPLYTDGFVAAADLTIVDLTLRNFHTAVQVDASAVSIEIQDCRVSDNSFAAVFVSPNSTATISESLIEGNGNNAIISDSGIVNLNNSEVRNNETVMGAVYISGSGASLSTLNSSIVSNTASEKGGGGGITNYNGKVVLTDTVVSGNATAESGGGVYQDGGSMEIIGDSHVNSNSAGVYGGGICSINGDVSILYQLTFMPEIMGNTAEYGGGGLSLNGDGEFLLRGVTVQDNQVDNSSISTTGRGGGIYYYQQSLQRRLTIDRSVIVNNQCKGGGGVGGGIYCGNTYLDLTRSTVSGNQSTIDGGGLYSDTGSTIELSGVTLTNNTCNSDSTGAGQGGGIFSASSGSVTISNSIVAGNVDLKSGWLDFSAPDIHGTIISGGYNLIGTVNDWVTVTGDISGNIIDMDPQLGPLSYDQYAPLLFSLHHPLLSASPAINGGNPDGCGLFVEDQLGRDRIQMLRCDMGAVESSFEPTLILICFSIDSKTITAGECATGTVHLNQVAPDGGSVISLSSNMPEVVVPSTVTVPTGAYSQSFSIQTSSVNADTLATLSACLDTVVKTETLLVMPSATVDCPDCSGDDVLLENVIFKANTDCECNAVSSITFGTDVTVESGAKVRVTAPKINFKTYVKVESGADFKCGQ